MSIEQPFDPEQRRRDALMDGSGFSNETADVLLGQTTVSATTEVPPLGRSTRKPRAIRRAATEVSGRDIARMMANQEALEHPAAQDQVEINRRGAALARAALKPALLDNISRRIHEGSDQNPYDPQHEADAEKRALMAMQRAFLEKHPPQE